MICPKCKADNAHRSHRRGVVEHLAGWLAIYPYRCRGCENRFLSFRYHVLKPAGERSTAVEREVRATRSAMRWRQKRRELLLYGTGLGLFLAFLYYLTRDRNTSPDGN